MACKNANTHRRRRRDSTVELSHGVARCVLNAQLDHHERFLARDSMLSALYAIARPSVRLSVRHTGGSVKNG